MLKLLQFSIKKGSVQFLSYTLTSKHLAETDVKIVILTSCTRVVLHPSCKMTFPRPGRVHRNFGRVCKKHISRTSGQGSVITLFPFLLTIEVKLGI